MYAEEEFVNTCFIKKEIHKNSEVCEITRDKSIIDFMLFSRIFREDS